MVNICHWRRSFIGSSIIDKLNKKKYNIYVVDNLLTGKYKNIPISNSQLLKNKC